MMFTWLLGITCLVVVINSSPAKTSANQPPLDQLVRWFPEESHKTYERKIPCSVQERECFEKGQLLHGADGKCYTAGEQGPCATGRIFHADLAEVQRLGGHLRGTCAALCEDTQAPFIGTGQCLTRSQVEAQYCRREWYMQPEKDAFGRWVCKWTQLPCARRFFHIYGNQYSKPYQGVCSLGWSIWGPNDAMVPPSAPVFLPNHPLLRTFADKSYVGREFPCSDAERTCLRLGRLASKVTGACHAVGVWTQDCTDGGHFYVGHEEMIDGFLEGKCPNGTDDQSPEHPACRMEWGLRAQLDVFGRTVCTCLDFEEDSRSQVASSAAGDFCRAPDFSQPARAPTASELLKLGFSVPCSEEEHACLRDGRVLTGGACHFLRTPGPCAEGEELVLDKEALAHGRLQAVCRARPCPEGRLLLPVNGDCLTTQEVRTQICPGDLIKLDYFGSWECFNIPARGWMSLTGDLRTIVRHAGNGTCELPKEVLTP